MTDNELIEKAFKLKLTAIALIPISPWERRFLPKAERYTLGQTSKIQVTAPLYAPSAPQYVRLCLTANENF